MALDSGRVGVIKIWAVIASTQILSAAIAFGQLTPEGNANLRLPLSYPELPHEAKIVEFREIPPSAHRKRALIVWIISPKDLPRHTNESESYTCPEDSRGWFHRGRTRVSLADTLSNRIINTIEVQVPLTSGWLDEFDIPYRIKPLLYRVEPPLTAGEGRPVILDLKDFNGDGKPFEFALFDAQSCSVVQTQLIGYSERQDRVVQYPIRLKGGWEGRRDPTLLWLDHFALQKPVAAGIWHYTRNYNSGSMATFDIRYDADAECFVGTVSWKH
jgi:hypothetical protein